MNQTGTATQRVIENMAPVLTRVFAPLFALLLCSASARDLAAPRGLRTFPAIGQRGSMGEFYVICGLTH
jgi:hypothetical protein